MNRLDTKPRGTPLAVSAASLLDVSSGPARRLDTHPARVCRLLVLIPADSDYNAAMRRVWELANDTGARVQLLSLCKDAAKEPSLRRGLVTMSALMRDGRVPVEAKVEIGTDWVEAVRRNYQAGDMIVCSVEQRAGLLHRPLIQILESKLDAPLYILSGLDPQEPRSDWPTQVAAWLGSFGIILGFGLLQARIVQMPEDWFQSALFILSIIPELWLILVWNSMFS